MGYSRAGFTEIVGVDNRPQPRYPFTFVLGDALEYLAAHGHEFDAIHASPPCQKFSSMASLQPEHVRARYVDLIGETRKALTIVGTMFVIENVPLAPLKNAVLLCGASFGLRVVRHRVFESLVLLLAPVCQHQRRGVMDGTYYSFRSGPSPQDKSRRPLLSSESGYRDAMGITWARAREARQSIPPAYTEFIGRQLLATHVG